MDSKVLTPDGFVRNGDLRVGDKVIAANGKESTILGVYPQGVKPLYDVYFDDGSKCRCSADHLWTVQTRDDRNKKRSHKGKKYRTIPLSEIMKNIRVGGDNRLNYSVDYVRKIDFAKKEYLIHPYIMGVLLGDGGLSQQGIRLSTPDIEILEKVNSLLPDNYLFKHIVNYDYNLTSNKEVNIISKSIIFVFMTFELYHVFIIRKRHILYRSVDVKTLRFNMNNTYSLILQIMLILLPRTVRSVY